ncbi:hypothetical protein AMAG_00957 [Allomyces macrogynus ATCC 38327]|uniref:Uncharacterized protein n=1 Tax=Allomyces macrogynus (strain ATCC 38327) TaxID=578462 RepID=A0A0L0RY03_ALLM3|nr:hypothetical protein AMAG_00957 [Allomyces macrogynus ATCC 38327]|eukprot:KNE55020.1 hypothetical protein AMAG_00957 [Allomyces macrogynus ATCC 38327]
MARWGMINDEYRRARSEGRASAMQEFLRSNRQEARIAFPNSDKGRKAVERLLGAGLRLQAHVNKHDVVVGKTVTVTAKALAKKDTARAEMVQLETVLGSGVTGAGAASGPNVQGAVGRATSKK